MKTYINTTVVDAGVIESVDPITPRGDYKISIVGADSAAVLPRNWVDVNLPQVGDYLVQVDDGSFALYNARDFEARFVQAEEVEHVDLTDD